MGYLLERFLPKRLKKGKSCLPNPNLEYRIIFKKGAIESIKLAKGWRTDAEMARMLGLTRAYITMLHRTRATVSSTVITRLAAQMGNIGNNWWIYYEIVPWGVKDQNHPTWNQEKFMGQIPYNYFSTMADFRNLDYKTEKENRNNP